MPVIKYNGTGDASESERDATLAELRDWTDGEPNRTLGNVEMRAEVNAVSVSFEWEVPKGEASNRIASLDSFITDEKRIPADLLKPTEGGATIQY